MRIVTIKLNDMAIGTIKLGFQGENEATQVVFDCTDVFAEYPDATPTLAVENPEGTKYPVTIEQDENNVLWTVSSSDTAYPGEGRMQLTFTDDTTVVKSYNPKTWIEPSTSSDDDPPDPIESWIDEVEGLLDDAEAATTAANNAAELANTKAGLANDAATAANAAATKIDDMEVAATDLAAGSTPTATITEVSGHKKITFGLVKGPKGDAGNGDMLAPAFAAGTANAAGTYVTYDGGLYYLPNGHTADATWANTTKTLVTVGGQLSDVKSAFNNNKKGILNPFDMVANSYVATNGTITAYNGWKRTDYTYIGNCISLVAKTSASSQYNCFYDSEKTFISKFTVGTSDTNISVPNNAVYVIFSNTNSGMDNLTVSFVTKDHNDIIALKDKVNEINNLRCLAIDETQFVSGYINSSGAIVSSDSYKTSPYLRCAMKRIKFNALTKDNISIAFYSDNTGTLIGSYTNITALSEYPTHEMDVPTGTKYIRIAKQISSAYVGSVVPYVISKESVETIDERIDSIKDEVDALTPASILGDVYREVVDDRNLVDNTAYTLHKYVNNSGEIKTISNPSSADYGLTLSDYIPVIAGKVIYLNNKFLTGNYWAYYDESKTWLGGKSQYPAWGEHLGICNTTVPIGAAYLRVTSYTEADAQALWAGYTGAEPTGEVINASDEEYVDYHYYPTNPCDYNGEEISVFNKIICIGDSITSGYFNAESNSQSIAKYAYPAFLHKLTGVETTNKGDAGETSVSWWAAHSSDDFSGYDCAIINLGINDVLTSVAEADTRSAFSSIISALKTANTGIKIFIANINPAYSRGNTTYDAINEVIEDIATTTENCYFIDLTQYGHAVGVAYADGHLTACGYLRLAQDYKAAIGWIIKNNPTAFRYVQFIGTNLQPAT